MDLSDDCFGAKLRGIENLCVIFDFPTCVIISLNLLGTTA